MPRPHKCRCISSRPVASVFKPAGVPGRNLATVELRLDELEAIRLADYAAAYHDDAAKCMGISRATFGRLIEAARRKVADALLNGKVLFIKGGVIVMSPDERTFECTECDHRFAVPHGTGRPARCPSCDGANFHRVDKGGGGDGAGQTRGRCRRVRQRRRGENVGAARVRPSTTGETLERKETP